MALLVAAALSITGGALTGCSAGGIEIPLPMPMVDAGPMIPMRTLTLRDSSGRTVLFGDTLDFAVEYAEADGRPVAGAEVAFAMVGVAHDSSLMQTAVLTDARGVASGTLIAGRTRASFRVRASAAGAAPAVFDVAVGDAGFGALRAEVRYAGSRVITTRVVAIHGGATCEDTITAAAPDREQLLVELDSAARFVALPAELSYAVVARGMSDSGALVTRGCVDDIRIVNGMEAVTVVAMTDVAVTAAGAYDVALDVSVPSAGGAVRDLSAAVVAGLELGGGDATFVLDAIALDVADRDSAAADALGLARTSDTLDASLARAFEASGTRPSLALTSLANEGADGLSTVRVTGVLELDARGVALPDAFSDLRISSLSIGAAPTELDAVGPTGMPTALIAAGFSPARSLLIVDTLDLRVWLGSTALSVFEALARTYGARDFAELVGVRGGCDAAVRWAASKPAIADVCGDSCVRNACESTATALVGALSELLVALDVERDVLHLEGEIGGLDADADTRLDSIGPGSLAGTWSTPGGMSGDVANATLSASRR